MIQQTQPVENESGELVQTKVSGRQNTAPITKDVIDVQDFN